MLQWAKMGFISEQEGALDKALRCVYPPGGTGNCAAEHLPSFAEEFSDAPFVVKNGSAEVAETADAPSRLSQREAKRTYSFIFTVQTYYFLRVHLYFHHQTQPL